MTVEIIHGDAIHVLPEYLGRAAMVYLDPCFNTGDVFKAGKEVAFEDKFARPDDFEYYLYRLMTESANALAEHGALWVHCDRRFQPMVRDLGEKHLRFHCVDQVVWSYRRWPTAHNACNRLHDYLLRFVLDPKKARWTQLYQPLAASTLKQFGARKQKAIVRDGVRRKSIATDDESPGAPLGDVWTDIPLLAPRSGERTGYPTQKPEELLARVIQISTVPGDLVIDPTCGSGTTLAAADKLGRNAVGIDRSEVAVRFTRERLANLRLLGV